MRSQSSCCRSTSVSQLSNLTSWSCQAKARRNERLSQLCPLSVVLQVGCFFRLYSHILYNKNLRCTWAWSQKHVTLKRFDVESELEWRIKHWAFECATGNSDRLRLCRFSGCRVDGRTVRKQVHRVESRMKYYWELRSKNARNIKALMCPL